MAHNLNIHNDRASMMYYGETPWHSLGTKLDKPATAEEAIKAAQLDYEVKKQSIYIKQPSAQKVETHFATVRMDTGAVLGVVGKQYEVIQNVDAFSVFDALVGKDEALYHTAGALGQGERIWILAKLPDYIKLGKSDIVDKYMLLVNSHNGWCSLKVKITPIRVVCENTLSFALRDQNNEVNIRHTKNAADRMEQAHKVLGLVNVVYKDLETIFERMSLRKLKEKDLLDYVKKLITDNEDGEVSTRRENDREKILELVEVGAGHELSTAKGTLWGAYNAATEFVDHIKPGRNGDDSRLASMWFGSGEKFKVKAFETAVELLKN
jgi:phage/plasmid-like protein (TIGR03299 family)